MPNQTSFQAILTIMDKFLRSMIEIEAKDVNLKFIFDHFKNYGICGLMLATGFAVPQHPKIYFYCEPLGYLSFALLVSLAFILWGLNYLQGISAFSAIHKIHAEEGRNVSWLLFVIYSAILFLVTFTLINLTGLHV